MSQVMVAVTPAGIVVGADSALTHKEHGEEVVLTNFPKIVRRRGAQQVAAYVGDAKVGKPGADSWMHLWLQQFLDEVSDGTNVDTTAASLAEALNAESFPSDRSHAVVIVAWEGPRDQIPHPEVWEVSRGQDQGRYSATQRLGYKEAVMVVEAIKAGPTSGFPIFFFSAGMASNLMRWLVSDGRHTLSQLSGLQIPAPRVETVEEFVRFSLRLASDLNVLAARPPYVSEPIATTVLFPDKINIVSRRR